LKNYLIEISILDKIQQDIDGILIELEDVDNNIDSNVKVRYIFTNINSRVIQVLILILKILKYLDTCVDYMKMYYDYKIK
jgi:hypothetical protein